MHEEKVKQLIQRYSDVYLHVLKIDSIIAEKVNKRADIGSILHTPLYYAQSGLQIN